MPTFSFEWERLDVSRDKFKLGESDLFSNPCTELVRKLFERALCLLLLLFEFYSFGLVRYRFI